MINKILIANRGEIAVRIIRACRELGIRTVAIFSDIDREALHAQLADESVCIGPSAPKDSYLNIPNIISATILTGADAIHPGFGFLSENPRFCKICKDCNIKFIGPDSDIISLMGDKAKARETMKKAGIPVIPGYEEHIPSEYDALRISEDLGFPVIIKASAGGGGKGIRVVREKRDFINSYLMAKNEAKAFFGNDLIYIEKYIENPRHIEFQILADEHGNIVHLYDRDCSIQRRNQKVLEESPSLALENKQRDKMGKIAVRAAKYVNYKNAGTIEFLLDKDNNFYFMEMNTRIQVEHPITEMITGIDIIKEQIRIANGEKLQYSQKDIKINGHAIECRINAESTHRNFAPSPGTIKQLNIPGGIGIRLDSAVYQSYTIPPFYDSMIAKLISFGKDREEAIMRMKRALIEFVIDGVDTNLDLHFSILNDKDFNNNNYNTSFLNKMVINK